MGRYFEQTDQALEALWQKVFKKFSGAREISGLFRTDKGHVMSALSEAWRLAARLQKILDEKEYIDEVRVVLSHAKIPGPAGLFHHAVVSASADASSHAPSIRGLPDVVVRRIASQPALLSPASSPERSVSRSAPLRAASVDAGPSSLNVSFVSSDDNSSDTDREEGSSARMSSVLRDCLLEATRCSGELKVEAQSAARFLQAFFALNAQVVAYVESQDRRANFLDDMAIVYAYYFDTMGGGNGRSPIAAFCHSILSCGAVEANCYVASLVAFLETLSFLLSYLKPDGCLEHYLARECQQKGDFGLVWETISQGLDVLILSAREVEGGFNEFLKELEMIRQLAEGEFEMLRAPPEQGAGAAPA